MLVRTIRGRRILAMCGSFPSRGTFIEVYRRLSVWCPHRRTLCHPDRFGAYPLRIEASPRQRPGSSWETLLIKAALRNCDLSNWTPPFAGEVACLKMEMLANSGAPSCKVVSMPMRTHGCRNRKQDK